MKMQIAFRETSTVRHGHTVAMAGGVIEIAPEEWQDFDEKALAFKFDFVPALDHAVVVTAVGATRPIADPDGWLQNTLEVGTLEDLLTNRLDRAIPNQDHNADFVLRQTELPASVEDGRVFAFSGIMHLKPDQKFGFENLSWFESLEGGDDHVMMFAGRSGLERRKELGPVDMVEGMRGESMSAMLRQPLWGFGDEPYGLPGTMRLDVYRKLDRYYELFFEENRTSDEQAEFEDVREFMRCAGLNTIEKDDRYRDFFREMRAQFPEFTGHHPMTADQIVSRAESSRILVESILKREDGAYA
ncbi:hypothetical protein G6L37_01690 [Agrobacterium rubi]|nr:hypothetical protein [Agrobacterium rubi]NTF24106.1 hypothetical protein [Agrobacterium rubi]